MSKYMVVGSRNVVDEINMLNPSIEINNILVDKVQEARNLGVVFDASLRFETHVLNAAHNALYRLKLLYKMRPYISGKLRVQLCESLVLSRLNYADTVYGPRLLSRTKRIIQQV